MTETMPLVSPEIRFDLDEYSGGFGFDLFDDGDLGPIGETAGYQQTVVDAEDAGGEDALEGTVEVLAESANYIPHITATDDQNEWMKVFVPSLLLEGFPRQIPASELLELNRRLLESNFDGKYPSVIEHSPSPPEAAHIADPSQSDVAFPHQVQQSNVLPCIGGTLSTSPPLTLSTFTYPYQTFDYAAPAPSYTMPFTDQPLLPPFTASFPGMEFLNFPETPGLPMSARASQEAAMEAGSGPGQAGMLGDEQLQDVGYEGEPDGWNIFRMPVGALAEVGVAESLKRKRGRPRGTFAPVASAQQIVSPPRIVVQSSPLPSTEEQAVIVSQEALEGELKAAVDELHARVRGILERTTPDIVRESGVSVDNVHSFATVKAANDSLDTLAAPSRAPTPLQEIGAMTTPPPADFSFSITPTSGSSRSSTASPSEPYTPTYKGAWAAPEIDRLRELVKRFWGLNEGEYMVDWRAVVEAYGPTRSKHQILCKAVELGLKGTTTTEGRRKKQKRNQPSPTPTRSGHTV